MEESSTDFRDERGKKILKFAEVDAQTPSPSERAKYLYDKLNALEPKPTHWDLVCFCAEAIGMLTLDLPATNNTAAQLLRMIYEIHYYGGDDNPTCLPKQNQKSLTTDSSQSQTSSDQTGPQSQSELVIEKSTPLVL
jgi:hypothetical protein